MRHSVAKRGMDIILAAVGLVLLSPVMAACALWIARDSPGPVLFLQERVGLNGRRFRVWKFRTMRVNSEAAGQLTVGQDSRVTRSGHFLRHWKLDELPQLWNVLVGQMSFVGPRPEVPRYVEMYTPQQLKVLTVRPGVTDLASIEFRNEATLLAGAADPEQMYIQEVMPRKLELNQHYISRASVPYDLWIILRTLWRILRD